MQNEFEHIVLTRFNLVGIGGVKSEQNWIQWNEHRFQVFKEYCLPSMLQQSTAFKWHLYFDVQTPEKHLSDIEELNKYPFIRTFFQNGLDAFLKDHMKDIKEAISPDIPWLITTRADNDDCLHFDSMAAIQARFKPQDQYIINLSSGYTYTMASGIMSHYFYLKSPFLSVVEDLQKETLMGVYFQRHSLWEPGKAAPWGRVIKSTFSGEQNHAYILEKPYWVQLIHDKNVSNDDMRGFPVLKSISLEEYGIKKQNKGLKLWHIPKYYHFIWWKRYAKGFLMKMMRLSGS